MKSYIDANLTKVRVHCVANHSAAFVASCLFKGLQTPDSLLWEPASQESQAHGACPPPEKEDEDQDRNKTLGVLLLGSKPSAQLKAT